MGRLQDKVAVITGASKGLGRALAKAYAAEGAKVVANARSEESLREVVREVEESGGEALAVAADISKAEGARRLVEAAVERFGRIDVLVNNAGLLGSRVPLADYPEDEWVEVIEANVNGPFFVTKYATPHLSEGASIINLVSGASVGARANWGAYSVSKFAVEGFSGNLALELKDRGIRVNAVDPGGMRTDMRAAAYPEEDPETKITPEENTEVFLYLASDDSREVTGERFKAQEFGESLGTA
ncbi:Dehydrogenases with different specificities (related to short-chain alcohol dehydrogenases) [Rubrobacter radiotolerans]|uniref:Dehydrogenases with different specificities (Related to short-chain alcohol dehydrogenases) n=1 Tax=Rubrobacter radiotolerans TaxID=42256 RepID=A0A023X6T5_RUBRA|nr:SDR family NAD(P)-dependent oxidoreductase [Rubrobacter radiotolerans]AHY47725.1 Dehydrogenases with different specificities (related to short-chain alcohol dehydrogenases) [Rubrobacter radiotolerans]MDX5895128.1 SDR family NAD(P)-dependent oxidoreductase [Rubrobacter radiotolerans]SMC07507.1 NAD(P)-dependent dehydrogenase, short-chain alcohol dehydrogenase family [Rubrobacter radiotolerans DSM 5868]